MTWTCVICTDVFENSSSVCCAPCGHIFHESCLVRWLQESRTCPQCRQNVWANGKLKLYPNVSSDVPSYSSGRASDPKNSGNNVEEELQKKNLEIGILKFRNDELVGRIILAETEASEFQQQKLLLENKVQHIQLQLDHLKPQANRASQLENDCSMLREELERYKNVKKIVLDTQREAAQMVKSELDFTTSTNYGSTVNKLATYICTLKKELDTTARKKNALYNELINLKSSYGTTNRRYARCKETCETLRQRIIQLERETTMEQDDRPQNTFSEANEAEPSTSAISVDFESSPFSLNFSEGCKKIDVIVLDENCATSSSVLKNEQQSSIPNIKSEAVQFSAIPTGTNQPDSITRNGYDGFGGHESVVRKSDVKLIRRIVTTNKDKKEALKKSSH